jgi:hypothetical protein
MVPATRPTTDNQRRRIEGTELERTGQRAYGAPSLGVKIVEIV